MKNILKILFLSLILFTSCLQLSYAQSAPGKISSSIAAGGGGGSESQIRAYLCAPSSGGANNDFVNCLNKLYKFAIAFGAIASVFWLVLAGYLYMSSDGDSGSVSNAKDMIKSVVVGNIILLISFVFLRTLNPDLVNIRTPVIQTIEESELANTVYIEGETGQNDVNSGGSGSSGGGSGSSVPCDGQIVALSGDNIVLKQASEKICSTTLSQLKNIASQLKKDNIKLRVTDAFSGNNGVHSSKCHNQYGTCADVTPIPDNDASYLKLCKAVKQSGLRIYNEAKSAVLRTECGDYHSGGTADHLHIY